MKQFFTVLSMLFLLQMLFANAVFSQEQAKDVVYLKNGSVIKGQIIEQVPNKSIKIQTADGNIFVYDFSEIEKITKETVTTQSKAFSEIWLGGRLGVNFTNISSDQLSGNTTRTGLVVGGIVEFSLSDMFALEPGVVYSQSGSSYAGGTTDAYNYIDIPVLIKAKFGASEVKPYLFAGPALGFEVAATETSPGNPSIDLSSYTSSINFSAQFGGGVEYAINPKTKLFGDVRYAVGLTDISTVNGFTEHTEGFSIQVGVKAAIN